jgi:hypothetical protein
MALLQAAVGLALLMGCVGLWADMPKARPFLAVAALGLAFVVLGQLQGPPGPGACERQEAQRIQRITPPPTQAQMQRLTDLRGLLERNWPDWAIAPTPEDEQLKAMTEAALAEALPEEARKHHVPNSRQPDPRAAPPALLKEINRLENLTVVTVDCGSGLMSLRRTDLPPVQH